MLRSTWLDQVVMATLQRLAAAHAHSGRSTLAHEKARLARHGPWGVAG
jgi:hypothetical protein